MDELHINKSTLRLMVGDITDFEIQSFVYYARHDLALGSGFGGAIAVRGGPSVQEELNGQGPLETTQVIVSAAGDMKAEHIFHAVGPRFQEEDLERKLAATITNTLSLADEKGVKAIAFPAMGAGFYGVPLDVSAEVTLNTICSYLSGSTGIETVVVSLLDSREYKPFQARLSSMAGTMEVSP